MYKAVCGGGGVALLILSHFLLNIPLKWNNLVSLTKSFHFHKIFKTGVGEGGSREPPLTNYKELSNSGPIKEDEDIIWCKAVEIESCLVVALVTVKQVFFNVKVQ